MTSKSRHSMFDLNGQTALITGGGTGLGFGMAKCFVACGAKVILVGRRPEELEKAATALGANAFTLPGDVGKL
jgi:NAD(P)-dependent dehydrogenase (short-subunit alcohol dehydrogenase family)